MSEMSETRNARAEPHRFVPPAPGTRDAEFGWCARGDCGSVADSYVHASEEERRRFDGQRDEYPCRQHENADKAASRLALQAIDQLTARAALLKNRIEQHQRVDGSYVHEIVTAARELTANLAILGALSDVREWWQADRAEAIKHDPYVIGLRDGAADLHADREHVLGALASIRGFDVVSDEAWITCDRAPCHERFLPQTLGEAIDWATAHAAGHSADMAEAKP